MFGVRLKTLRMQRGLTQQVVADTLQVDRTTYTKYEAGRVSPDQQGLSHLADIFGVTVDFLLGREFIPLTAVADAPDAIAALTPQEKVLLQMFRQLSTEEKNVLVDKAQAAFRKHRMKKEPF